MGVQYFLTRGGTGTAYYPDASEAKGQSVSRTVTYTEKSSGKYSVTFVIKGKTFTGSVPKDVVGSGEYWNLQDVSDDKKTLKFKCNGRDFSVSTTN